MKLAIIALALAVCSAKTANFKAWPPESSRLVTENFTSELEAVLKRNWYVAPVGNRANYGNVYQMGDAVSKKSRLYANMGWGLYAGHMTQYKFSFIGDSRNCEIGFTELSKFEDEKAYHKYRLNLSTAPFTKRGVLRPHYLSDIGKDSDDVDWFIEYHDNGRYGVYVTRNGEPFGDPKYLSLGTLDKKSAKGMRPFLRCNVDDTIDPKKGIAVIQYQPIRIPEDRPYAKTKREQPKERNFIITDLRDKFPDGFGGKKFEKHDVIKFVVTDLTIAVVDRDSRTTCHIKFLPDHVSSIKVYNCMRPLIVHYEVEPFAGLQLYMRKFLQNSNRYEYLPSGDLTIHSPEYGSLVFKPADGTPF